MQLEQQVARPVWIDQFWFPVCTVGSASDATTNTSTKTKCQHLFALFILCQTCTPIFKPAPAFVLTKLRERLAVWFPFIGWHTPPPPRPAPQQKRWTKTATGMKTDLKFKTIYQECSLDWLSSTIFQRERGSPLNRRVTLTPPSRVGPVTTQKPSNRFIFQPSLTCEAQAGLEITVVTKCGPGAGPVFDRCSARHVNVSPN